MTMAVLLFAQAILVIAQLMVFGMIGAIAIQPFKRPLIALASPLVGILIYSLTVALCYSVARIEFSVATNIAMTAWTIPFAYLALRGFRPFPITMPILWMLLSCAVIATVLFLAASAERQTIYAGDAVDQFNYGMVADWIRSHP